MASLARKIKRQQPLPVSAPLANPPEVSANKVAIVSELFYKKGYGDGYNEGCKKDIKQYNQIYNEGFNAGFRAAYGHFLANMAYLYKYHADIFDNPSNRFRILFDIMRMMNEDYLTKRTPKMLDALEDLRRQGVLIEVKEG